MTDDSQSHISYDATAETMRLILPLMAKHAVPASPANYAVWYDYVRMEKPALSTEIDRLIAEGTPFTDAINHDLYTRHVLDFGLHGNSALRSQISGILGELLKGLNAMGEDTLRYSNSLQTHTEDLQHCDGLQRLEQLLLALATETKEMHESTRNMRREFEDKSREIQALQTELEQVKQTANTDPLTGLPNRRALLDAMENLCREESGSRPSLLMLDIDNFKAINDGHGHLIGDRVIRFVADVIRQNTKGQDTPSRFGGEEFAVLLPNTPLAGALTVAESIRHAVATAKLVRSGDQSAIGQITVSGGVATYRQGEDSMELMDRADQALYLAKHRGRNKMVPETEL